MTTREDAYKMHLLIKDIENSNDDDTIEIPRKIALTILRKMLIAERLFEDAFYEATASYGTNHVEGRSSDRKQDKEDCKNAVKHLRYRLNPTK